MSLGYVDQQVSSTFNREGSTRFGENSRQVLEWAENRLWPAQVLAEVAKLGQGNSMHLQTRLDKAQKCYGVGQQSRIAEEYRSPPAPIYTLDIMFSCRQSARPGHPRSSSGHPCHTGVGSSVLLLSILTPCYPSPSGTSGLPVWRCSWPESANVGEGWPFGVVVRLGSA